MRNAFFAAALVALTAVSSHTNAAQPTVVGVTGGVPYANITVRGETFFTARFDFLHTEGGKIILSGAQDGTDVFYADDAMEIKVNRPDGTVARRRIDFSHGCANNHAEEPTDLTALFKPGINKVTVKLLDGCGGAVYASPMFLSTH